MRDDSERGTAPDYTDAFLVSFGVVVFMILFILFVLVGMLPTLAAAWLTHRGLNWRGGQASETT